MKRSTSVWIAIAVVFVVVQLTFFIGVRKAVRGYRVPTGAMSPTIRPGENVLVRITKNVSRGDVVAFRYPLNPSYSYVSRIVAVAGDTLEIRSKKLFLNGAEVNEPYAVHEDPEIYPNQPALPEPYRSRDHFGPFRVPPGHFFTLSDNRDHASDGRYWGALPAENVTGRVMFVYSMRGIRRIPALPRTPPAPAPR